MKLFGYKHLLILFLATFMIFTCLLSVTADNTDTKENYPINVKLTIRSQEKIIAKDDFFKILEMDDYILLPLVSLTRWLDIDLSYDRKNELLTVYHNKNDKSIIIDLQHNIYYNFPQWSKDPPLIMEEEFYVTTSLIEYLSNSKVEWIPGKQELVISYKYEENGIDDSKIKADITGPDFSIGSIHYETKLNYEFKEDSPDTTLTLNNHLNIYGRFKNWTITKEQLLNYNFETDNYDIKYPFLSARNYENNQLIVIGDNRFSLSNTIGRINLRGIYFQEPIQQISSRRAYTSITGQAPPESIVSLYTNDKKIDQIYLEKGENNYHFENISLIIDRINYFKIVITDKDEQKTEIIKKIAGSSNIFESGTNEMIFALGNYNKKTPPESILEVGGMELKYAPNQNISYFWELGTEKVFDDSEYEGLVAGNLARISLRPDELPLVLSFDWLTSKEFGLIEHGYRVNTLFPRENGHIKTIYSYVPPLVVKNVDAVEGQYSLVNFEQEINDNWFFDLYLENNQSILDMEEFDLSIIDLAFDYKDKSRNSFTITTELASIKEDSEWRKLELTEKNRDYFNIILEGKTYKNRDKFGGEISYDLSNITFYENIIKQEESAFLELNSSKYFTDNFTLSGNFETEFSWFEEKITERETEIDLRARLKTGKYTYLTAGLSSENKYTKDYIDNDEEREKNSEIELFLKHNIPRSFNLTTGIKKTYLEKDNLDDENYLSGYGKIDYQNTKNYWELELDFEYIAPYGTRNTAQEKIDIELSKKLFSGLEGIFNIKRDYVSSRSENPYYEASISFSQTLGFSQGKIVGQDYNRGNHSPYIAGLVYLDENGNKKRDPVEPLLKEISVFRDRTKTLTDEKGYFIFENVRTGLYEVGVNLNELNENYTPVTKNQIVKVRENENIFLELGLTKLGEIRGQIFIINGKKETETIELSHVELKIEELNRTFFTNNEGKFILRNVPLGQYTIKVMEKSLPVGVTVSDNDIYKIKITSDKLITHDLGIFLTFENKGVLNY
ncbi:MAG: MSCRAMM family protein [Bacillota bacterium]